MLHGLDFLRAGRELAHCEIGFGLRHRGLRHAVVRLGLVKLRLGDYGAAVELLLALEGKLRLDRLRLGRSHGRVDDGDFLGALAELEVGELSLGLGEAGFRLADLELGIAGFKPRQLAAGRHVVAALDEHRLDMRDIVRGKSRIFAFDKAGEAGRLPTVGQERREDCYSAPEAHGRFSASINASTLSPASAIMALISLAPISCQLSRRSAPARAIRNRKICAIRANTLSFVRSDSGSFPVACAHRRQSRLCIGSMKVA